MSYPVSCTLLYVHKVKAMLKENGSGYGTPNGLEHRG